MSVRSQSSRGGPVAQAWAALAPGSRSGKDLATWERSRQQQAGLLLADWPNRAPWMFSLGVGAVGPLMGVVIGFLLLQDHGLLSQAVAILSGAALGIVVVWIGAWVAFFLRAPSFQLHEARAYIDSTNAHLAEIESQAPRLAFEKAILPKHSQQIDLYGPNGEKIAFGTGRIVRVPVVNALGCRTATKVHARLDCRTGSPSDDMWAPPPCQGEWFNEEGKVETEIDLPGNGRPRLIDVVLILDGPYPHAHQWTVHSRAALLRDYAIQAGEFDMKITVSAEGDGALAPQITDTLRIRCVGNTLSADWLSTLGETGTNYVPWQGRAYGW